MPTYRFVCFERQVFADFPQTFCIGELPGGSAGGLAVTHPLGEVAGFSRHVVVKMLKGDAEVVSSGEELLSRGMTERWQCLHQEYVKLVELNGLGGHAPRACAFGAVVWDDDSGERAQPAFAMEDMRHEPFRARSIAQIIDDRRRGFSAAATLAFGAKLLDAIGRQKECGITHADLSSNNVLVRVSPDASTFDEVYVIDYGQAKYADSGATPRWGEGRRGPRLATIRYGAPEVFPFYEGSWCDADHERAEVIQDCWNKRNRWTVDLWSLGALLFLVRTGVPPQPSVSRENGSFVRAGERIGDEEGFSRIVLEKRRGLSLPPEYGDAGDAELRKVIALCTMPNPDDRAKAWESICASLETGAPEGAFAGPAAAPENTPEYLPQRGVWAVVCKLHGDDGSYSDKRADMVMFVTDNEYFPRSVEFDFKSYWAEKVEEYEMSNRGWSVSQGMSSCPWQDVELAFFADRISPKTLAGWFAGCTSLKRILCFDNLNTADASSMRAMFYGCSSLRALGMAFFDTANMRDMSCAFYGCESLRRLDVSRFVVAEDTDVRDMFSGCTSLEDLRGFSDVFGSRDLVHIGRNCPAVTG